jgi:P27 family predicted phage terminase small subunit
LEGSDNMPNPSVPIHVMIANGKPHRSNKEIEKRKKNEKSLQADDDNVKPPTWLCKKGKKIFKSVVGELIKIKLATNLDVNSLAIYSDTMVKYIEFENEIERLKKSIDDAYTIDDAYERNKIVLEVNKMIAKYSTNKLKLADTVRKFSVEFGLTSQSRARLAIPKKEEKEESEFDREFGAV